MVRNKEGPNTAWVWTMLQTIQARRYRCWLPGTKFVLMAAGWKILRDKDEVTRYSAARHEVSIQRQFDWLKSG